VNFRVTDPARAEGEGGGFETPQDGSTSKYVLFAKVRCQTSHKNVVALFFRRNFIKALHRMKLQHFRMSYKIISSGFDKTTPRRAEDRQKYRIEINVKKPMSVSHDVDQINSNSSDNGIQMFNMIKSKKTKKHIFRVLR
jgi:hypothetical protein